MAINKKLIHFKNKEAFDRELQAGNILETSICFVPDAKFIYTRGSYWYCPYSKEEIDQKIADSSELTINTINLQLTLLQTLLDSKLDTLVSGTSIKTVNGSSLLGSGDISVLTKSENGTNIYISNYLETITDVPFGGYKVTPSNTNDSGGFTAGITMGASGLDAGFMTIYTTDNGTEPIYAAQYDWNGSSEVGIAHYITLMDSSGNQIFNQVTANGYYVADKTSNDLLNAAGGTVSVDSIATVKSASGTKTIWTGTQSEYEAIDTKDANTLYFITEE